jgi:hypothetical protein
MEDSLKQKPEPFKLKQFTNVQSKINTSSTIDTEHVSKAESRPRTAASARGGKSSNSVIAFGRTTS